MNLSARGRQVIRESTARAVREAIRGGEDAVALAGRLHVTRATIARWQSGRFYPSFTVAQRIAPLLGVDPETGQKRGAA